MKSDCGSQVLNNFNAAAKTYNQEAHLQRAMAWRLAKCCSKAKIPSGVWIDLGSGTGLLADALETLNPNEHVLRIDGSPEMLDHRRLSSQAQIWDLNFGLPSLREKPTLIASSFALHWLSEPERKLKEWFAALAPKGWMAIAVPIKGSFYQWHHAAELSGVACSALPLPSERELLKGIPPQCIQHQKVHCFTQKRQKVVSLLKPMKQIGAQGEATSPMGVASWRQMQQTWPRDKKNGLAELTWLIKLLLIQR